MNKHTVRIYDCKLQYKPDNKTEGYIYKNISKGIQTADHVEVNLQQLMEYATNGAIFQVGLLAENKPTVAEQRDLKELYKMNELSKFQELKANIETRPKKLEETTLIVIDIDNELGNVNPKDLIDYIKPNAFYYTFSHNKLSDKVGTKQNALRLVFELNKPVNKELGAYIEGAIVFKIKHKFPFIDEAGGEVAGLQSKTFIFGSQNKDYKVFNREPLKVENYEVDYQNQKDIEDIIRATKINNNTALDNNELIDMAKFLANKGVYLGDYNKWAGLVLGIFHTANLGVISEELALEIVMTFDQHRESEEYYLRFKTDKQVANPSTIASFIKLATDNGYKRKQFNSDKKIEINTQVETLQIDTYLSVDDALGVLKDTDKRILIDSPTGTGKTYSFIEAVKSYLKANQDTICYFAMPTRALSTQPAETYGLGIALMGNVTPKRAYQSALVQAGTPLVIGTYDKANMFIDNFKHKKIIVIADEAHKEVLDYNYRAEAINGLFNLRTADNVIKFIGLSGTPQEIDLNQYDKVVKIKQRAKREVFKRLDIVTYDKAKMYAERTTELIVQEVRANNKVLVFMNNKKTMKTIQRVLRKMGIKASMIASKENLNRSKNYRYIMEDEAFPKDSQVILATTVIADGINIKNESENYVCMVAPHYQLSPLFNASIIKQASNRFRNPYKKLILPYFIGENVLNDEKRANETRLFNYEWKYRNLMNTAEGIAKYTENRFKDTIHEYSPSIIERISGMYYQNPYFQDDLKKGFNLKAALQEEHKKELRIRYDKQLVEQLDQIRSKLFKVDSRVIRQRTSEAQERYYQYFPYAFIKELERTLEAKANLSSYEIYIQANAEQELIKEAHHKIEIAQQLEEKEKEERLSELLTEYLYEGYFMERQQGKRDGIFFNTIESVISRKDFIVLDDLVDHCTYEEAIHLMKQATNRRNYHAFKKSIKALIQWDKLKVAKRSTPTKLIINLLLEEFHTDSCYTPKETKEIFKTVSIGLKKKVAPSEVESIYKEFFVSDEARKNKQRFRTNYRIKTMEDVASEFALDESTIERIYISMGGRNEKVKKIKKFIA